MTKAGHYRAGTHVSNGPNPSPGREFMTATNLSIQRLLPPESAEGQPCITKPPQIAKLPPNPCLAVNHIPGKDGKDV